MRRGGASLAVLALAAIAPAGSAAADADAAAPSTPLRLRADALAQAESPVGLVALEGTSPLRPWLRAEALVWVAGDADGSDANVLVVTLRAHDPKGRADARLGRMVVAGGALRPVHVDGVAGRVRLPGDFAIEGWGGIPVAEGADRRTWDWLAGTRLSRALGDWGAAGVAFGEQRDHGRLARREVGVDAVVAPLDWLDAGWHIAWDLVRPGVSEAVVSTSVRRGPWRLELTGIHRSPSRLLPATSLFSVLGDTPSNRGGALVHWRAAPRLDVDAGASAVAVGDDVGADVTARARLRLDDRGAGACSLELRRESLGGWTGARAALFVPLGAPLAGRLAVAAELELVVPDEPAGRGEVWPWGLVALRWQPAPAWETAIAVEASAGPTEVARLDALFRLSRSWEMP